MLCIPFLLAAAIDYTSIGETVRRLRERLNERFRGIRNRFRGFPVAEHFNSASQSLDDMIVCGLKQCSCNNISRKQHERELIFKLGTLRPIRTLKQWFSFVAAGICLLCTSLTRFPCVHAHIVVCMAWLTHYTH